MVLVPKGSFSVRVGESSAINADVLLGQATGDVVRTLLPSVATGIARVDATVRGFLENPLHPARGRDKHLADYERGLDVDVSGGTKLRAFDAMNERFMVHLMPPVGSKEFSVHVSLAPEGDEKNAIVQTDPHSPDAPVGFYNLGKARAALDGIHAILEKAAGAPDTSGANRLRAGNILARVDLTRAYLADVAAAAGSRPKLQQLETAAQLAHDVRKKGDAKDTKLGALLEQLDAYVAKGADNLSPELLAQAKEDLSTIRADREKWLDYHASVSGYYLFR